jgi:hypothetical protein
MTYRIGVAAILAVTGTALVAAPAYADAGPGSGVQVSVNMPAKMGNNADPTEFAVTATNGSDTNYGRLRLDFTLALSKHLGDESLKLEEYAPRVSRWEPLPTMHLWGTRDRGSTWGDDFALPAHATVTIRMRLSASVYDNSQTISTDVQVRRVTGIADPDPTPLATTAALTELSFPTAEVSIKRTDVVYLPAGGAPYEFALSTANRTGSAYSGLGLYLQLDRQDHTADPADFRLERYDATLGWQPAQSVQDGSWWTNYLTNAPAGGRVGDGETMMVRLRLTISPNAHRQTYLGLRFRVGNVRGANGSNWGWQPNGKSIGIV